MNNKIGKDCIIHKKTCDLFCTYSKCVNKILCQKCVLDHLQVHPKQFIYNIENLCEIHAFDKVSKMKQTLGKYKVMNEQRIIKIYNPFEVILNPLISRVKQFQKQSKDLMTKALLTYLSKNKNIIENIKVAKSDTNTIKTKPQLIVDQTIAQVELINQKEKELKENTQKFTWYADATQELCTFAQNQLNSMINVSITLLNNLQKIQASQYTEKGIDLQNHHEESFFKRYMASHEVASKGEKNNMEMTLVQSKEEMRRKEQEIKRARNQIKEKVTKIQELQMKIEGLKEEILQWEQKQEREERERKQAAGRERKKLEQFLIKNDIISDGGHTINLSKKSVQQKYFWLIFELVPNPVQLQLNAHQLHRSQLTTLYKCTSLLILRMSFMPCDKQFLAEGLKCFQNLHTIELNSSKIDDDVLKEISMHFPSKLKHLHLIDNQINDDGLEYMFLNLKGTLQSLLVSYNMLSPRSIDVINRYCYQIKTLHISKNLLKNKGAISIGKYLKDIQQLFIGGTGIQKQGFLAICRGCLKLRRLSLVQTEISTDIISEILLGLQKLEWLDISYSNLSQADIDKVEKLKIFNKGVEIIAQN